MRALGIAALFLLLAQAMAKDCSELGTNGTIYSTTILSEDYSSQGDCITIGSDNVTLDCAGHSLTGRGGGTGIYAFGRRGVEIRNCHVSKFNYGAHFSYADSSFLEDSAFSESYIGIYISSSSSIILQKNSADRNGQGIYAYDLRDGMIAAGSAKNNKGHGLEMRSSISNKIRGNDFSSNQIGIGIYSSSDVEITGNDLRACYEGIKQTTARSISQSGNAQDIISGSGWDSLSENTRTIVAIALVIMLLAALTFIIGITKPKKPEDKLPSRDAWEH